MKATILLLLAIACFFLPAHQMPGNRGPGPAGRNEDSLQNCTALQSSRRHNHVSCEADGSFSPVQCMGRKCYCVNTTTGEKLRPVDQDATPEDCSMGVSCREVRCGPRICTYGYKVNDEGCPTCMCERPPPRVRCDTIQDVLEGDCHCSCVAEGGISPENMCPACNMACTPRQNATCIGSDDECPEGKELRSVGRRGRPTCVSALNNGAMCMVRDEPSPRGKKKGSRGAQARMRAGQVGERSVDCQNGSTCVQTAHKVFTCVMQNDDTSCRVARMTNENINCDREGRFRPLQCDPIMPVSTNTTNSSTDDQRAQSRRDRYDMMCRCVTLNNGTVIEGSEVMVVAGDRMPNCEPRDCMVPGLGRGRRMRRLRVKHGETYFDTRNCRSCQCADGDPETFCSEMGTCTVNVNDPANCTLENGTVLEHGAKQLIECERCGCSNGRVRCVRDRRCEREMGGRGPRPRNMCDECAEMPPNPVCGPDGRNHLTACAAMYCAGIPLVDLYEGPCQSLDVCEIHPCENETHACLPRGGVACVGNGGCEPDQLRTCIDLNSLQCAGSNDTVSNDEVCGTDGTTYTSICELIQSTQGVQVAHSGACEDAECTEIGEVCGSDGVTYPNPCVLSSKAVTRLDYVGPCVTDGNTLEEICTRVRETNRCAITTDNCPTPVQPESGCCPVCGGTVTIAIDQTLLTDAASIDPQVQTVDYITSALLELFAETEIFCEILIAITDSSYIEISFVSTDNETLSLACSEQINTMATVINEGTLEPGRRRKRQSDEDIPPVYDYTVAASTAPQVQDDGTTTTDDPGTTTDGAVTVHVKMGALVSVFVMTLLVLMLG